MKTVRKNIWWSLGLILLIWYGMSMLANAETMGLRYLSTDAVFDDGSSRTTIHDTTDEPYCMLYKQHYYTANEYNLYLDCEIDCGTDYEEDSETYLVEVAIQINGVWREILVDYLDGGINVITYNLYSESLEKGDYKIKLTLFKTNRISDAAVLAEDQCTLTVTSSITETVSFNYCGGSGKTSSKVVIWGENYSTLPTATKKGYNFLGWYTKKSGGTEITSYSEVTTWGNHTLYAHWVKPTQTQTIIVFDDSFVISSQFTKTYSKNGTFYICALGQGGTISYTSSNKKVATISSSGKITMKGYGTTKIKITASSSGAYKKATTTVAVTIKPAKMTLSSVKSSSSKTMLIRWKSDTKASGYQVQVSTSSQFTTGTTTSKTTSNVKNKKVTLKNLTKGKKYYVRIRAYKTVNGKKVYGPWSTVKSATVK